MPGSILRVKFLTGQEAGEVPAGPAVPLFIVNGVDEFRSLYGANIEGGEPLYFRTVVDREPSSYIAIPVYAEG